MAIVSVVERADVSASRRFGEAPKFQRKWVVEVDDPTTPQTFIVNACGVRFLDQHPEAYYCRAMNTSVGNYSGSRFHYEVTWDYELPRQSEAGPRPQPAGQGRHLAVEHRRPGRASPVLLRRRHAQGACELC
jgi:hypothetical protein